MKRYKKILVVMGVTALTLGLAACGKGNDTDKKETSEDATAAYQDEDGKYAFADFPEFDTKKYVTLGDYKNMTVEMPVSADALDESMMQEYITDYIQDYLYENYVCEQVKEGEVPEGAMVNASYKGLVDGEVYEGVTNEAGVDFELGSGFMYGDFEANLVGVPVGTAVTFAIAYPEDYGDSNIAGKSVDYEVIVNYVKKLPELTDAIVAEASEGGYQTVAELEEVARTYYTDMYQSSYDDTLKQEIAAQACEQATINGLPDGMKDWYIRRLLGNYQESADSYGIDVEELLTNSDIDVNEILNASDEAVLAGVTERMVFVAIADAENISLSDEEYAEQLTKYAGDYGYTEGESFEAIYGKSNIHNMMLCNKVMDYLLEQVEVTVADETTAE